MFGGGEGDGKDNIRVLTKICMVTASLRLSLSVCKVESREMDDNRVPKGRRDEDVGRELKLKTKEVRGLL